MPHAGLCVDGSDDDRYFCLWLPHVSLVSIMPRKWREWSGLPRGGSLFRDVIAQQGFAPPTPNSWASEKTGQGKCGQEGYQALFPLVP